LFWEICNEFIGDKIPQKIDVFKWYEIIKADYSGWKCNFKYDIDYLLSDIQKEKNVENLSQNKFSSDILYKSPERESVLLPVQRQRINICRYFESSVYLGFWRR